MFAASARPYRLAASMMIAVVKSFFIPPLPLLNSSATIMTRADGPLEHREFGNRARDSSATGSYSLVVAASVGARTPAGHSGDR
jgi:hypothetical protein